MTDQGSTRASVSIAWRLVDLRAWIPPAEAFRAEPRFCQAEVAEFARPAVAPLVAEVAAEENPLLDE